MIHWYNQNNPDDRNEDALGIEQAEHKDDDHESEEEEDLVVILITHGAGSNALIGAITEQPVLLDVGMASLTMAVKREDAPPLDPSMDYIGSPPESTPAQSPGAEEPANIASQRRGSFNTGLSAMYEMKIIASTEHLRPGSDPSRASSSHFATRSGFSNGDAASRGGNSESMMASWNFHGDRERVPLTQRLRIRRRRAQCTVEQHSPTQELITNPCLDCLVLLPQHLSVVASGLRHPAARPCLMPSV